MYLQVEIFLISFLFIPNLNCFINFNHILNLLYIYILYFFNLYTSERAENFSIMAIHGHTHYVKLHTCILSVILVLECILLIESND